MNNAEIARAFLDLASLLELRHEDSFRVRAFRTAARAVESLSEPAGELLRRGTLTDIPGIGEGCARRVEELEKTGRLAELADLGPVPRGLTELLRIEGMGPRSAELVWRKLGITTIDALEEAARAGRLRELSRFGAKKEAKVLRAIETGRRLRGRWRLPDVLPFAEALVTALRNVPGVERVEPAGSLRRHTETVGDIDLLVSARPDRAVGVIERFVRLPEIAEVVAHGATRAAVKLHGGLQADLRVVAPATWGAALHYFTGSKEHNIAVRTLAVRRGLKMSEYGVFDKAGRRVGGAEESEVFASVGLPWIEPELRENRGEIEAAAAGCLPTLITLGDLRGDLHVHTQATDGHASLRDMVLAARAVGHEYLAITDHSQALAFTRGLDASRLRSQGREIRALDRELGGQPHLLRGIEVDILSDGALDLGPDVLARLGWVVASVHSRFALSRGEQTRRVVRAIESGVVDCIGHPTGRLLGQREPYALDIGEVLTAARRAGVAMELNAFPDRLDLGEQHLALAKQLGVPVVISSDSHAPAHLRHLRFGVHIARRAWLGRGDVLNCRSHAELRAFTERHHRARGRA